MKKRMSLIVVLLICVISVTGCSSCNSGYDTSEVTSNEVINTTENDNVDNSISTEHAEPVAEKKLVVLDPGHQTRDSSEKEPIGPGSSEMKLKDTSGATGVATGIREYEVIMTRTQNEGRISCMERAQVANNAGADAYVRIHANSVDDSSVTGAMTICMTSSNPYNSYLYNDSKRLSVDILDEYCAATGAKKERIWETDTMSGNNWSQVPVTLIEMGYMSNPNEDRLMATDDYQTKIVNGIANGVDRYFAGN